MSLVSGGVGKGIDTKSVFGKIKDAKMRVGGNYVREGRYLLRMDAIKLDTRRNGLIFMAVEMTVLKILDDSTNHKVGEQICHWMDTTKDSFLGNVKSMIAHLMEIRPEEVDLEHCEQICAADQPLTGNVIELHARQIVKKSDGKPFTEVNYKREVQPAEAISVLDAETLRLYFPNDVLAKKAAYMQKKAAERAAASAPASQAA